MTLTELKYIVAVARERHFGRAAEACFVSQPTLSVAVKKLEDELDVKIFERGGAEVSVTPLGEQIVRQAQQVIEQASAIKEIAKLGKDPVSGPLRPGDRRAPRDLPPRGRGDRDPLHPADRRRAGRSASGRRARGTQRCRAAARPDPRRMINHACWRSGARSSR